MSRIIELQNLSHAYRDADDKEVYALQNINLDIDEGEFVAIIGTNGSGKSTLARHLNALLLPSGGRCLVEGRDTLNEAERWDVRQTVGMVFQNPDNQIVAAVVEEDVAFGPENMGVPSDEIRERVTRALEAVDMLAYAKHAPHLLSGGQKQRVAIAGALALQPRVLVLDEATAMLDPRGRREILTTVKNLQRERGMTVVYITHYMEEALAANRIVVMENGRIKFSGTPHEVFSRVEELNKMGLEAPLAAELAAELRADGFNLPEWIITDEELVNALESKK